MYLYIRSKDIKQLILNNLNDEFNYIEVMYWRKDYLIHEWFCNNFEIENCEFVEISKENLLELIEYLNEHIKESGGYWSVKETDEKENEKENKSSIKQLNEVIEKTDWENNGIFYYTWW